MRFLLSALALATVVCQQSVAAEPNETFATRTTLSPGVLTVSDVLTPGLLEEPDTLLGIRGLFGDIVYVDDDGSPIGNGYGSGVGGVSTNSGSIDFAVTGVGDDFFSGSHGQSGQYEVFVDVYDFFGDLVDSFSEIRTLGSGEVHEFTFNDFEWLSGTYDVYINNALGGVTGADVDFFTFTGLSPGATFSAETLDPTSAGIDTFLGWFDAAGALLDDDDDGAGGTLSKLTGIVPANGMLTFAVTGFGDDDFMGAHTEDDPYELQLTIGGSGGYAADFNNDGMVTGADLADWRSSFGPSATGDADGDSDTDGADFLIWQRELGVGVGVGGVAVAAAVPEPSGGALVLAAAMLNFAIRRRRRRPRGD